MVIGATLEAANAAIRRTAATRGALFGWHRITLRHLAYHLAAPALAVQGLAAVGPLARQAVVARIVQRLAAEERLGRFGAVSGRPGLPRALAATLDELRMGNAPPEPLPITSADLAHVYRTYLAELRTEGLADRADVYSAATKVVAAGGHPLIGLPTLMLDVQASTPVEERFIWELVRAAPQTLATCADGDERSLRHLKSALRTAPEHVEPIEAGALARVQSHLFEEAPAQPEDLGQNVAFLSAPGEGRECVELARLILEAAERGTPFDRMAILLRAPELYRPHLHEALRRARIPAWFAEGIRQPDPAGRALLALLACAAEGLSASRFAEYLSLGEVPAPSDDGAPPPARVDTERWTPGDPELLPSSMAAPEDVSVAPDIERAEEPDTVPVLAGTLRAPRRWEKLLVDASVIGGDPRRWERRLGALAHELELRRNGLEDSEDPREGLLRRREAEVVALQDFGLPMIRALSELPARAAWGTWLERLGELATRALRSPERVLGILAELRPMAAVGPVSLDEVRLVLSQRLAEVTRPSSRPPAGRVWVSSIDGCRGMDFDVVLVPGLAERIFPRKVAEDPILLDAERRTIAAELVTSDVRVAEERLALRLAVGAATEQLVLSYPRLDMDSSRPRVPSFYGLEVMRAAEGRLPGYRELQERAGHGGAPRIGWPAPASPLDAIDVAEHDLALLAGLFKRGEKALRGGARHLVAGDDTNPHLARALRFRYQRWYPFKWTPADGLVQPGEEAREALAAHGLAERSYSATALQNFAKCPYKFVLYTIHKLGPREEPVAIEELDALQRGSLIHDVQYRVLTTLREEGIARVDHGTLSVAQDRLEQVLEEVVTEYKDRLSPAIDRVWTDAVHTIRGDVRQWLDGVAEEHEWWPWRFELAFGLPDRGGERDEHSVDEPVSLDCGIKLRGSIDLVERNLRGHLRATDYKTGKASLDPDAVIAGGEALQPVLYALALDALFPESKVESGRLHYCTARGGFEERDIPLDEHARKAAALVGSVVGKALSDGFFPAAPAKRACRWCDYRVVCGDSEEFRSGRKPPIQLADLKRLREAT